MLVFVFVLGEVGLDFEAQLVRTGPCVMGSSTLLGSCGSYGKHAFRSRPVGGV